MNEWAIGKTGRLLLIAALFSGCGSVFSRPNESPLIQRAVVTPYPPSDRYFIEDESCQTQRSPLSIHSAYMTSWNPSGFDLLLEHLWQTNTSRSLRSPAVNEVIWGRKHLRECDQRDEFGAHCLDKRGYELPWKHLTNDRKLLRVCRDQFVYDRDSIEAMALSTVHRLNTARQRTVSARPNMNLQPLKVELVPHFVDRHTYSGTESEGYFDRDYYLADNMAYFPSSNMLAVFPETQQRAALADKLLHYWESSFVLFHEFGHHVQQALVPITESEKGVVWHPTQHSFLNRLTPKKNSAEIQRRALMWSVIAEAFADAFAYYAAEEKPGVYLGLETSLSVGRNVRLGYFEDGLTEKKFTVSMVQELLSDPSTQGLSAFQDPHRVGAVLAHALDRIFDAFLSEMAKVQPNRSRTVAIAGTPQERYRMKLQLLFRWLEQFAMDDQVTRHRGVSEQSLFYPLKNSLEIVLQDHANRLLPDPSNQPWKHPVSVVASQFLPLLNSRLFSVSE